MLQAGCLAPARLCNGRLKLNVSRVLPKQKPLKWKGWKQMRLRGSLGSQDSLVAVIAPGRPLPLLAALMGLTQAQCNVSPAIKWLLGGHTTPQIGHRGFPRATCGSQGGHVTTQGGHMVTSRGHMTLQGDRNHEPGIRIVRFSNIYTNG